MKQRLSNLRDLELTEKWGTVFDELKADKSSQWFYGFYFLRRLGIASVIVFVNSHLMQLVLSAIFSLSIALYVLTIKCFALTRLNVYIVTSEFLLISFYLNLIIGILSIESISLPTIGSAGIRILMVALCFNAAFALYELAQTIYKRCRKGNSNFVFPAMNTISHIERGNVTMVMDPDDLFRNPSNEIKTNLDNK